MTSTLPTLRQTDGTLRPQSSAQPTKHHAPKRGRYADRVLEGLTRGSAITIISVVIAIGTFLLWRAIPAISNHPGGLLGFLTYAGNWNVATTSAMLFGIPNLLATTVLISALALMVAMPVALGVSIFLNFYSPRMLRTPLGFLVDMVAAVPSIVFGLWGWQVLGPALSGVYEWLARVTNGFFLFHVYPNSPAFATGRNILTGAVVLSVMILPVIAATTREVLAAVPRSHVEAALALGATKAEMIRMVVLPFGRNGFIAASMLGLGRALGETMAIYLIVSPSSQFRFSLFDGGTTFATAIANAAPEFNDDLRAGAYIAAGLMLFIVTFVVNSLARLIAQKSSR